MLLLALLACDPTEPVTLPDEVEIQQFHADAAGGYDDFGEGAAFGYAVDEGAGRLLVVGFRLELPLYEAAFEAGEPLEAALGWPLDDAPGVLADDLERWPALMSAAASPEALRRMSGDFVAAILEGDLASGEIDAIYVAGEGTVILTREDEPRDEVKGELVFSPVSGLGDGASLLEEDRIGLRFPTFSWLTGEQP